MANKPLQTIKFPGLTDTYTVPQVDSNFVGTAGQVPDSKKVHDEIDSLREDLSEVHDYIQTPLVSKTGEVVSIDNPLRIDGVEFELTPVISATSPKTITGHENAPFYLSGEDTQNKNTIEIEFPVGVGVVYGGIVDTKNNKLTVTKIGVDLGSLSWSVQTFSEENKIFYVTLPNAIQNIKLKASEDTDYYCECEKYAVISYTSIASNARPLNSIAQRESSSVKRLYVRTDDTLATNTPTGKAVFECAEPVVFDLPETVITPVEGINKLWVDSGDITVWYRGSVITQLNKNSENIENLKEDVTEAQLSIQDHSTSISTLTVDLSHKVNSPINDGTMGQVLSTNGNGTTTWKTVGTPTDQQTANALSAWLNEHPEAVTTVQDGAITKAKLSEALALESVNDYVTPEMYGAKGDGITDDTSAIQAAINSGKPIRFVYGKTYIATGFTVPHGTYIDGCGATIKRPNLTAEPYNWTTSQISWGRMFVFASGGNVDDKVTVYRNLTIDGNAFEMWQESDGYKYEHATFFPISGNASYQTRVIIDGCRFKNNYASAISVQGYSDLILTNCISEDCFTGIVTFVGVGCTLRASNLWIYANYDSFHSINIEINGSNYYEQPRSDVYIDNCYAEGNIKLCGMTGGGSVNVRNLYACKLKGESYIDSSGLTNISDSEFHFTSTGYMHLRPVGSTYEQEHRCTFNIVSTRFICDDTDGVISPIDVRTENINNEHVHIDVSFTNCLFNNLNRVLSAINTSVKIKMTVMFSGCKFDAIKDAIISSKDMSSYGVYGRATFNACVINIDENAYIVKDLYPTAGYNSLVFCGGNIIEKENAGLYLRGNDDYYVVFHDEYWSYGNTITYTVGTSKALGKRYRIVDAIPQGDAFDDCDVAYVNGVKYMYVNGTWTSE